MSQESTTPDSLQKLHDAFAAAAVAVRLAEELR
jgi:hypothetical protein